ncbi:hypothetical protein CMV_023971 [Castanea mollissima]|uniref:Leucine-rich repeat-containing N-terminal plant-type domain-containing protein n=1 Tax=Castanea mollissima TaxID=60419 RepID=A0A8J4QNK4_9ROSI|nr:hypothetical protein CMV_023971 [Castanea mollissima]
MDGSFRLRAVTLTLFLVFLTLAAIDPKFCYGNSEVHCIQSEQQALLRFKHDLTDPLNRLASWAGDGDCCQWVGVVCNNITGHVQELHLRSFPPPLIEYFSIDPHLGSIPPTPNSNFSSLATLDLSFNSFESALIPSWVFGYQNLVALNLSANGFQGTIPIGLQNMTSLKHLDLSANNFNSSIPNWLYSFSHLEFLNLRNNLLQGTISSSIRNLTSAVSIDLTSNQLDGKDLVVVDGDTVDFERLNLVIKGQVLERWVAVHLKFPIHKVLLYCISDVSP